MQLNKKSKIFIAGHKGMVGSSILRHFKKKGYKNLILINHKSLDLIDQKKTNLFIKKNKTRFRDYCCCKSGRYFY